MRTPLPVFSLLLVSFFYECTSFSCPRICRCSSETIRCKLTAEAGKDQRNKRLAIAQSVTLETIEALAFSNLLNLSEISIQNARSLMHIDRRAFNNLPNLRLLEICDNIHLLEVPPNAFTGMTEGYATLNLYNNGIRGIHNHAFNGTKIDKLYSIDSYFIIFFI
ncbi:hypothetical protein CCH79_00001513 [Gambusia affinis]|uniref:LRRNT domain-containing protein n=1 Tax=Gambusia affinis TaxID=33528 RepID=A0A315VRT7_GAMAF|nr:hypothetical protein CCH79_00001513 [Gambusia affinis]